MRSGGIVALSALALLALGPSAAQTAGPALSAARCAAAEFTAYSQRPEAERTGDAYERIQTWRSLALDEADGTARWIEVSTAFLVDPALAAADASRCLEVDPLKLTPPMPENPKGDFTACDRGHMRALEITATALRDFRTNRDGGAFCRLMAEADALLLAERAEMAGGKSTCDLPQYAWVQAGDQALTNRLVIAATAEATGKSCLDFEGKRSASL